MNELKTKLMESRAESTATAYIRTLTTLNGKAPFKNLSFLKRTDAIDGLLSSYANTTKKSMLACVVAILTGAGAGFKKAHKHFYEQMMDKVRSAKEADSKNEKTNKQKDAWISWEAVQQKHSDLLSTVEGFSKKKSLTATEYDKLLQLTVLSLYTMIPPRRNQDYLFMHVVKKLTDSCAPDKNYYDMTAGRFVFRKYKTAKTYGEQVEEIPKPLQNLLTLFLRFHPLRGNLKTAAEIPLLVSHDGKPLTTGNAITRILNKVLGGRVGASMLRHIYLSSKYGDKLEEMKKDSALMGHSLDEQRAYVKTDTVEHV